MKTLFAFFGSLSSSIPSKVLTALGLGFISSAGLGVVINSLVSTASANWGGIGGASLQLLSVSGFATGFGMILGAIVTRTALTAFTSLGRITQ